MHIFPVPALKDNYIWVVINPEKQCALVVDPGDATPVISFLKQHQLELSGILVTHHHWDHVNGVAGLLHHQRVPVYGSVSSQCPEITHRVDEGDRVFVNDCFPVWEVFNIPGHTLDHIAYFANKTLFCGDTLFAAGCGRLFEGTAGQLYTSLQKLAGLPDDTKVCCAHEYTLDNLQFALAVEPGNQQIIQRTTQVQALRENNHPSLPSLLSEEKRTNPFLRCEIPEVIHSAERQAHATLSNPVDVFAVLRRWKNAF